MKKTNRILTILIFIFLYIPMFVLIVASFNTGKDITRFEGFTLARYAEVADYLGIHGKNDTEKLEGLIALINDLKKKIGIKDTIRDYGIDEADFLNRLDDMVEQAFDDQCTGANPRYPLLSEIKQMYLNAYYGK